MCEHQLLTRFSGASCTRAAHCTGHSLPGKTGGEETLWPMIKVWLLSRGSLELHSQDSCEKAAHLTSRTFPKLPAHARTGVKTSEKLAPRIRLLALPVTLFKQSTDFTHEDNIVYEFKKLRNLDSDVTLCSWNTFTLPSTMTILQSPLLTENSNKKKIVNGAICTGWDKTQMLLQGHTGHRYPHSRQKHLAHLCPRFKSDLLWPSPAEQGGLSACQQQSWQVSYFSREKRENKTKKSRKRSSLLLLTIFQQFCRHLWPLAFSHNG